MEGCTVKLNVLLRELPDFVARPGPDRPHHYGQPHTFESVLKGEVPVPPGAVDFVRTVAQDFVQAKGK
jgi:hypothetical protein